MATPRLKDKYTKEIVPSLKTKFQYKSVMQVPKIDKICINKGMGVAVSDKKLIDVALEEITTITGQKAVPTKSKKDI
jgi:large subunit ribosomal protein L5